MIFNEWFDKGQVVVKEHSTTILTAAGVTGTVTVAYLSGKASVKAYKILDHEQKHLFELEGGAPVELDKKEKLKLVWKEYIPTVAVGSLTVASIVGANRISSNQTAAMVAAYGVSEKAFSEYKDKVAEHLTKPKNQAIKDEIAQDRVNKNPPGTIIMTGAGEVLCYDGMTGRYFKSSVEAIKKAQNEINHSLMHSGPESLSAFYGLIGLPATSMSDELGWNSNELMDITFSTTMSPEGEPCIAIDFARAPIPHYFRTY